MQSTTSYNPLIRFFQNNSSSVLRTFDSLPNNGAAFELIKRIGRIIAVPFSLIGLVFGLLTDQMWKKIQASDQKLEEAKRKAKQEIEDSNNQLQEQKDLGNRSIEKQRERNNLSGQLHDVQMSIMDAEHKIKLLQKCIETDKERTEIENKSLKTDEEHIKFVENLPWKNPASASKFQTRHRDKTTISNEKIEQARQQRALEIQKLQNEVQEIREQKVIEKLSEEKHRLEGQINSLEQEIQSLNNRLDQI